MTKKIILVFSITLLALLSYSYIFVWQNNIQECLVDVLEKEVKGQSMQPILQNGEKIDLYIDYYKKCNIIPKKWDIIAYNYFWSKHLLIKQIHANQNDIITNSWSLLLINNKVLKNSAWEIYNFRENEMKIILFFVKNNKLSNDNYLIFGDNIHNSIDSRKFWAVNKNDFLGKFKLNFD